MAQPEHSAGRITSGTKVLQTRIKCIEDSVGTLQDSETVNRKGLQRIEMSIMD
jgi:hypothetical protein